MVATHYDQDHFNGLTALLGNTARHSMFAECQIYDQGWPYGWGDFYQNYVEAINTDPSRYRATGAVSSDGPFPEPIEVTTENFFQEPATPSSILLHTTSSTRNTTNRKKILIGTADENLPRWLLGKEILWRRRPQVGNPAVLEPPLLPASTYAPGTPGGPPSLTCIAVNGWVLRRLDPGYDYTVRGTPTGETKKNKYSLAFLLEFNGFRYFIGGDLTTEQEDALVEPPTSSYLSTSNGKLPIHALKLSHHGSEESSSPNFLDALKPLVAFASCGPENVHQHPRVRVLKDLWSLQSLQTVYLTNDGGLRNGNGESIDLHKRRMNLYNNDVHNTLTKPGGMDFQGQSDPKFYNKKTIVAGAWKGLERSVAGNVVLLVHENKLPWFKIQYGFDRNETKIYFDNTGTVKVMPHIEPSYHQL